MKDFRSLKVWEKSHLLALKIYQLTGSFPKEEIYGLTRQIRRAVVSIPTNIAEGCGRGTDAELAQFCQIAVGSASEVEYLLLISHDLGLLTDSAYETLNLEINEVKRMLISLLINLRPNRKKPPIPEA